MGIDDVTMTGCVVYCAAAGYSIVGNEYARQCFYGNALASASTQVADDMCDIACDAAM